MSCFLKESVLENLSLKYQIRPLLTIEGNGVLLRSEQSSYKKNKSVSFSNSSLLQPLREKQKAVIDELKFCSCLFHLPTGFGKTVLGLFLSSSQSKTLILVPRKIISDQWKERLKEFLPEDKHATVEIKLERSFYHKMIRDSLKTIKYDMVIVDEMHMNEDLVFSKILPFIHANFLFGFTASPKDSPFKEHYFKQTIFRHETKDFSVFPVRLNFNPGEYYIFFKGRKCLDYNKMLSKLTRNENRLVVISEVIMDIVNQRASRSCDRLTVKNFRVKTLILVKNINTVQFLYSRLSLEWKCDTMYGNKSKYSEDIDILIGTYQKMGVGFDSFDFHVLILLDNVKNIIQAEGRIRNFNFVLYDFIDDHTVFENHWKTRRNWYLKRGANIENPFKY